MVVVIQYPFNLCPSPSQARSPVPRVRFTGDVASKAWQVVQKASVVTGASVTDTLTKQVSFKTEFVAVPSVTVDLHPKHRTQTNTAITAQQVGHVA